ncbi:hypothetical protein LC55x_5515 [Lysobacter capsici]|nr:hypothetical protein LC55x_5515 [Lysobacter capsici]
MPALSTLLIQTDDERSQLRHLSVAKTPDVAVRAARRRRRRSVASNRM